MTTIQVPRELMNFFNSSREVQLYFAKLGLDANTYAHKVVGGEEGNIVELDASGDMKDSGISTDELKSRAFFFARNY